MSCEHRSSKMVGGRYVCDECGKRICTDCGSREAWRHGDSYCARCHRQGGNTDGVTVHLDRLYHLAGDELAASIESAGYPACVDGGYDDCADLPAFVARILADAALRECPRCGAAVLDAHGLISCEGSCGWSKTTEST